MRPCLIEVGHILIQNALALLLLQDQQVIQAFLTNTSQETFTDGIGSGSMNGGFEQLDATGRRHTWMTSFRSSPRMRSAPKTPIVRRHLSDQGNRFGRDLRRMRSRLGLPFPIQAKELPMPA